MLLVTAATEIEINPLKEFISSAGNVDYLVTGMGPVATAARLSRYLATDQSGVNRVVNIGVGGAFPDSGLDLLDICLAKQEFFGDFGVCMHDGIEGFDSELSGINQPLQFDQKFLDRCRAVLADMAVVFKETSFVTVNCCSGTEERGRYLQEKFNAGCENMEGAAVALVCSEYNVPCIELRSISNMVKDRNVAEWKLKEAVTVICDTVKKVLEKL